MIAQSVRDSTRTPKVIQNEPLHEKKASINFLLLGGYVASLTDSVDMAGAYGPANSSNGFYITYARLGGKFELGKRVSFQFLANLADFKNDPEKRVLEIATAKWSISPYLNVQAGQFRPYFGLEDMYPSNVMKSNAWSKQYGLMSKCNYESFQIGIAAYGSLQMLKIPLKYYCTIYNGNGKNQLKDDDSAKNHAFRIEYEVVDDLTLGANATFTKYDGQRVSVYGADLQYAKKLNEKWTFETNAEYKTGTNLSAYKASISTEKNVGDYVLQAFYIIPSIAKMLCEADKRFLEFSCRYESLTEVKGGNVGQFFTPMLSYAQGEQYTSKISVAGLFSQYDKDIVNTAQYGSTLFLLQYQLRF